uniref:Uncharacterized protein n=1 Tax=Anguilla anguilla TaxID=7936 RepID=A0A0E9X8M9_ANGAN
MVSMPCVQNLSCLLKLAQILEHFCAFCKSKYDADMIFFFGYTYLSALRYVAMLPGKCPPLVQFENFITSTLYAR